MSQSAQTSGTTRKPEPSPQETLYDKPYEDGVRVRVSGPFTVESLSPHRVLSTEEETPRSEVEANRSSAVDFATMILDNLKKAGGSRSRVEVDKRT